MTGKTPGHAAGCFTIDPKGIVGSKENNGLVTIQEVWKDLDDSFHTSIEFCHRKARIMIEVRQN